MSAPLTISGSLSGAHRLVIEPAAEGVYLFVFETAESTAPERDYLQDTLEQALAQAQEDFGTPVEGWTAWEGPSLV
jgi:hypothetical protein